MRYITTRFKFKSFCDFHSQIRNLSSSSSKLTKPKAKKNDTRTHQLKNQTQTSSLLKEITQILGSDDIFEANSLLPESSSCTEDVCRNDDVNVLQKTETLENLEEAQTNVVIESEVSSVVREVTKVIRSEHGGVGMEERLRGLDVRFDEEVVDNVLKRCFKVPHLAYRFFNLVKGREGFLHTTRTYNTMLYIAREAQKFELVDRLVEEMEKSCGKDVKTWTILISQYGKGKMVGKALSVFEKLRKSGCEPDRAAYKEMVRLLCAAGKGDVAMEFYGEMVKKEMVLDLNSYKMLLKCLAKAGYVDSVQSVADDMIGIAQLPEREVYGCLLRSFCMSGRITEAMEFIRDLRSREIAFDPEYFEVLVKGLCKADRIKDALEIVEIMKRKQPVSATIYETLIDGYMRVNDLSKALDIFQTVKESGQVPTVSTYTGLMQHLFRINEYQKGCELYNELLETGVKLDAVAFTAMVAGHVRHNHITEAWKVFRSMQDRGIKPTWKLYSIFIKELCRIESTEEIMKVLNEMQASKIKIGDEIFNWVLSYLKRKGDKNKADKIKELRRIYNFEPQKAEVGVDNVSKRCEDSSEINQIEVDSTGCLTEKVSKPYSQQDLQKVCEILSSSFDSSLIQEALEKCSVQFTPELVLEVLRRCTMHGNAALHFFSWLGSQSDNNHTTETYNMAIKIAGCGKDFKHMRSLLFEMRRKGLITSETWTIVIMQYGRTGLTGIALSFFEEMKADGFKPTSSTYKYMIMCLCGRKGRKVDMAIKLFNEMTRSGHLPDKELVETYLGCLCDVGELSEARKCRDYLCEVGFTTPLSTSIYIRALCRVGRLDEALELIHEAGDERSTLEQYTYGSIVHALLQRGQLDEALEKVESLKLAGISPTTHVYTSLIVYYLREKKIDKALEIFNKMKLEGCEPTIVTYSALIRGYMNMGKVEDAWDVFRSMKMKGPLPDFKMYSMFITSLCRAGRSEDALQLLSEMKNAGIAPSSINYNTVFYGLNREGKQDLACSVMRQKSSFINNRKFLT